MSKRGPGARLYTFLLLGGRKCQKMPECARCEGQKLLESWRRFWTCRQLFQALRVASRTFEKVCRVVT